MASLSDRHALSSTSTSCSSNRKSRITRSRCRAACCSASATRRCRRSVAEPQFALTELAALRRGRSDHLQAPAPSRVRHVAPAAAQADRRAASSGALGPASRRRARSRASARRPGRVLVAGAPDERSALYLAANGCDVTTLTSEARSARASDAGGDRRRPRRTSACAIGDLSSGRRRCRSTP